MKRAYSVLEVKSFDEEKREIEGIATTPTPDRVGDIVEPRGARFKIPMPLLWQHNHDMPVGHVTFAKPTRKGIPFKAKIARIDEPGILKDRVDEAWQSVKSRLVGAVSIGFRAVRDQIERLDDGGLRFKEWEWLELSLVTIPANADATITSIKSLDREALAASGRKDLPGDSNTPGASGKSVTTRKESTMDVDKQVAELEERREELVTEMRSFGDVTDLDDEQANEYDEISKELEELDTKLTRVKRMQAAMGSAKAVGTPATRGEGTRARGQAPSFIRERGEAEKLEPGIAFARIAKAKAIGKLENVPAREVAKHYYGPNSGAYKYFLKAAVPAATTGDSTWAGPLVGEESSAFADFVEFLRPQTILGRFGANGIPALRRVPFRVALIGQTSGGDGYWVGEGNAKPLTKFDFARQTLEPLKVANIAVATEETLRDSSPSADGLIRDALADALRERLDLDFIDPDKSAVAGVSPGSITNGATAIAASGTGTAENVRTDIKAAFSAFIAANNAPTSGVWIMPATTALSLSLMLNPLGQSEFPGLTMNGGMLQGLPVIVSEYVPTDSSGAVVALVKATDIYLGDEGGIAVDLSREASLQMDDNPSHNSGTPTGSTSMVSMFQTNSVAFRAERTINWMRRRDGAVVYLTGVQWGD